MQPRALVVDLFGTIVGDGGDDELQGALQVGMKPVLLRVEDEIEEEGESSGAARWKGHIIHSLAELPGYLDQAPDDAPLTRVEPD